MPTVPVDVQADFEDGVLRCQEKRPEDRLQDADSEEAKSGQRRTRVLIPTEVTRPGFEPGRTEPKSVVLPLHYRVGRVARRQSSRHAAGLSSRLSAGRGGGVPQRSRRCCPAPFAPAKGGGPHRGRPGAGRGTKDDAAERSTTVLLIECVPILHRRHPCRTDCERCACRSPCPSR